MYKNLIQGSFTQIWANIQNMDVKERKRFIKYVIGLNKFNCSFIEFAAKDFLITLIKHSECYFNGLGYDTEVKEFKELGL